MTTFTIIGDEIKLVNTKTLSIIYIEQFTVAILNKDGTLEITGMKDETQIVKDINIADSSVPSHCYNTVQFITKKQIIYVSTDLVKELEYVKTSDPIIAKVFRTVSPVSFNIDQDVLIVKFENKSLMYVGSPCDCKTFADLISYKQKNRIITQRKKLPIEFAPDL